MNLQRAQQLQKRMPYKQILFDTIHKCFRLIDPHQLYEYQDDEGKWHPRPYNQRSCLIPRN